MHVQCFNASKVPDIVGHDELTTRCYRALKHHVVIGVTQKRSPQKVHVLQVRDRCQVAQKAQRCVTRRARWQMFWSGQDCLPFSVERHRKCDFELSRRQHRHDVKAGAVARVRSSHKDGRIENYSHD